MQQASGSMIGKTIEMKTFLKTIVLDNPVSDYLWVVGFILLVLVLKKRASKNFTRLVFIAFRKMGRRINEQEFFDLVLAPLENFIVMLAAYLAIGSLQFPDEFRFKVLRISSDLMLERVGSGLLIFFFFHTLLRVIDYLAVVLEKRASETDDVTDDQLIIFFREFLKVILIIICILVMIRYVFNQDITKLLAGLSIVGAAIALAAKESLENLIASFIIFFDRPFMVGDLLKVQQVNGTVEKIGLRSTRIRTTEKTYVTIPNKQMVDGIVDNISQRNKRRGELMLQLSLKTPVAKIHEAVHAINELLQMKDLQEKTVLLQDIKADAYQLYVEYFTDPISIEAFHQLKQKINFSILEYLEEKGIGLAGRDRLYGIVSDQS
jgi:MscS family membrane protein